MFGRSSTAGEVDNFPSIMEGRSLSVKEALACCSLPHDEDETTASTTSHGCSGHSRGSLNLLADAGADEHRKKQPGEFRAVETNGSASGDSPADPWKGLDDNSTTEPLHELPHDGEQADPPSTPEANSNQSPSTENTTQINMQSTKLYGRDTERIRLMDIYHNSRESSSRVKVVFISGSSGTGKTRLALSLRETVQSDAGFFVMGKCQLVQTQNGKNSTRKAQLEPYAPFIVALTDFFKQALLMKVEQIRQIKTHLMEALSEYELRILQRIIPRMADLLKEYDEPVMEEAESLVQKNTMIVRFAFRRLLYSLGGSGEHPLVLCLDDVHWADEASTELLDDILHLHSPHIQGSPGGLLIVACFREDEVWQSSRLDLDMLLGMDISDDGSHDDFASGAKEVTRIALGPLSSDSVTEMISDHLGLSLEESLPLTKLILPQSQGNAFMVHHILRSLQNKEELSYEETAAQKENTNYGGDIIKMMATAIENLPIATTNLLKVASCLYNEFSPNLLLQATIDNLSDKNNDGTELAEIEATLIPAIDKGLVILQQPGICVFSHDKVQEAAYSLILQEDEQKFLLEIGRRLQTNFTNSEITKHVFLLTRLLSPGVDLMYTEEEHENLILLCLAAGRQSTRFSSFSTALEYIEFGISLLSRRSWRDQYEISLELYNAASELSYCTGNHEKVDVLVQGVLFFATSFEDEMQAHRSKILSLGSRGQHAMACSLGFSLLRKLGHPFPHQVGRLRIKMELWWMQRKYNLTRSHDIINLPMMSDSKAMACMSILHLLHPNMAAVNPALTAILSFRMVSLTMQYGICSISSVGFALYGLTLTRMGHVDDGYRYGIIAFQLLEKLNARELAAKTRLSMACGGQAMKESFQKAANSMLVAHDVGIRTGDIETAIRSLTCHGLLRTNMGVPLPVVAEILRNVQDLCHEYGQNDHVVIRGYLEGHSVLMGESQEIPGKEELEAYLNNSGAPPGIYHLCGWFFFAIYCDDPTYSASLVTASEKLKSKLSWIAPFLRLFQTFYEAMVEAAVILHPSTTTEKCKYGRIRKIRKRLEQLRKWALLCLPTVSNVWNKVHLVEAELEVIAGNYDQAMIRYKESIEHAEKEGFLGEAALANEKLGHLLVSCHRKAEAREYFSRSMSAYESWGASVKVDHIRQMMSSHGFTS